MTSRMSNGSVAAGEESSEDNPCGKKGNINTVSSQQQRRRRLTVGSLAFSVISLTVKGSVVAMRDIGKMYKESCRAERGSIPALDHLISSIPLAPDLRTCVTCAKRARIQGVLGRAYLGRVSKLCIGLMMVSMIPFCNSQLIPDYTGDNHIMTRQMPTDERIGRYLPGHTGVNNRIDNESLLECPLTCKRNVTCEACVVAIQGKDTITSSTLYHSDGQCNRQIYCCLL
jgi:hypothetical protein